MAKTFNGTFVTLDTSEGDIYTAPSKAMSLLIQVVNTTSSAVTCELWMTDGSNNHVACLFPSQSVAAYNGVSDTAKHVILNGYKIRGLASAGSAAYVEISTIEGM
jgi:hypothetical protein